MEFFNNIWVALSTPNQMLVNVLLIPAGIIENILILNIFISILNIDTTRNKKILYVSLMTIISLLNIYVIPNPINICINYIFMIVLAISIFKISILKGFLSMFLSSVIISLISMLISNPYMSIFNIDSQDLNTIPIYRFSYLFIVYIITFFIILIIKKKNIILSILDDLNNKNKCIILTNLIFAMITFIFQLILAFYYLDTLPVFITFVSSLIFLIYFSISIFSLTRIMKLNLTTKKLECAEEYNNTLRILHDNVRGFKHDFDNIVTTIGGYIRTNDMEGLKQYYLQLEDDCQRVNNLYILNPSVVNNDGIYNLIMKKYHEAEEKDIKVNISFLLDLSTLNMKIYEFARILGILLDNAIEASSECEEKIINLTFRNDSKNSRQLIIVENTYKNKDVDTHKIFEKGVSGKENHTGLGLWEVNKILSKNKNITLFTTKNDKYFSQQLEIYYNN